MKEEHLLMEEKEIDYIFNFFSKLLVVTVVITDGTVSLGNRPHYKGCDKMCYRFELHNFLFITIKKK